MRHQNEFADVAVLMTDLVHILNLFVYTAIVIPSVVYEHGSHDGKNITRILVVYGNACVILERSDVSHAGEY